VARLLAFANVAAATVDGGTLCTPWGDLGPAPTGTAAVLVRPDAVVLDPAGLLEATVRRVTFAGARTRVRLAVDGAPDLEAEVSSPDAPAVGSRVRVRVAPAGVRALPA
jgi:hypothetical protein